MGAVSLRIKFGIWRRKCLSAFLKLIPKERGLVLCSAWFGQKYIDNTKYMFEYLLSQSHYKVFWITKNKHIFMQLKNENMPVLKFNTIKGIIKQIRAQAVFSTVQFSDYDTKWLSNTIYLDLGHGHPIKDPGKAYLQEPLLSIQKQRVDSLHYYAVCASEFSKEHYQDVVRLPEDQIIISDFARNDVFVDESLRKGKNKIVDKIKGENNKAIVYMPTHRSDGKKELDLSIILPLEEIEDFCKSYGYVFIIKKHFYHRREIIDLSRFEYVFDITNEEDIDPQVLLFQADILITDYSACYIDYLLLNRPMMFYHFDVKDFQEHERSLYIPFDKIDIAPIAYSKEDFINKLKVASNPVDLYQNKRNLFRPTYFANSVQVNGREKIKYILDQLIKKYY